MNIVFFFWFTISPVGNLLRASRPSKSKKQSPVSLCMFPSLPDHEIFSPLSTQNCYYIKQFGKPSGNSKQYSFSLKVTIGGIIIPIASIVAKILTSAEVHGFAYLLGCNFFVLFPTELIPDFIES